MRRVTARITATAALSAAALLLLVGTASAHVTVAADDATRGANDAILTFRVPNEMDNAVTTAISFTMPTKSPLVSVKPEPKAGWTITTKTVKFNPAIKTDDGTFSSGVGEVTYTANSTDSAIPVDDFEAFHLLVGPLPDTASLKFPTIQTYSNGKTVAWVEPVTDPANIPDHPVPSLDLTTAPAAASTATPTPTAAPTVTAAPAFASQADAKTGKTLGITGIAVGALGLLLGAGAMIRARRPSRH